MRVNIVMFGLHVIAPLCSSCAPALCYRLLPPAPLPLYLVPITRERRERHRTFMWLHVQLILDASYLSLSLWSASQSANTTLISYCLIYNI